MTPLIRWLTAEVASFRAAGHRIAVKRHHLIVVTAVVTAAIVLLATGALVGRYVLPYRTLPKPPVPATQQAPPASCDPTGKAGQMGRCLPRPKGVPLARAAFATSGPITVTDLSNNDPVRTRSGWAAIAAHVHAAYVKSVEGLYFTDSTAAMMAAFSKAFGLPVGGYDFMHVCQVPATAEAAHFVGALYAQRLLGRGTLRPAADAEFPFGSLSCNGRVWVQSWVTYVYNHDGHVCPIAYTGAWWWQPHIGAFWPTCRNVQLTDWISGYGVRYPYMPSGRTILDLWQNHDNAFNGAVFGDLSIWMHSPAAFNNQVGTGVAVIAVDKYAVLVAAYVHVGHSRLSERATVKAFDKRGCARRHDATCSHFRREDRALDRRLVNVARRSPHGWTPNRRKRHGILARRS